MRCSGALLPCACLLLVGTGCIELIGERRTVSFAGQLPISHETQGSAGDGYAIGAYGTQVFGYKRSVSFAAELGVGVRRFAGDPKSGSFYTLTGGVVLDFSRGLLSFGAGVLWHDSGSVQTRSDVLGTCTISWRLGTEGNEDMALGLRAEYVSGGEVLLGPSFVMVF